MKNKVLVINTGGTIGMIHEDPTDSSSPLKPAKNWDEIAQAYLPLKGLPTDYIQFPELIDSSNMSPKVWVQIAQAIEDNYNNYVGFVILHGTDTMAYTSSTLSFMLKNLGKPVVITGSQVPLSETRNDAYENLVTAIYVAGNKLFNLPVVPEVMILFRDVLLRGNRSMKMNASDFYAFDSPNFPILGDMGEDLNISKNRILKIPTESFYTEKNLYSGVISLDIVPGMNPKLLINIIDSNPDIKGIVLKTFGNGNAPTTDEFFQALDYVCKKGIVVVNITQCPTGFVKMGLYETSAGLSQVGVISGQDMTPEAAIGKLMYLLGKNLSPDEVRRLIQLDIVGEQTISNYLLKSSSNENVKSMNFKIDLPKRLGSEDLIKIFMKGVNLKSQVKTSDFSLSISDGKNNFEYSGNLQDGIEFLIPNSFELLFQDKKPLEIVINSNNLFSLEFLNIMIYTVNI